MDLHPPPATSEEFTRIDADLLIPGCGTLLEKATCIVRSGTIAYVGLLFHLPDEYQSLPATHVPSLLPGLWDAHVHYYGSHRISIDASYTTPTALAGARAAYDFAANLDAGFTSVRKLSGWAH